MSIITIKQHAARCTDCLASQGRECHCRDAFKHTVAESRCPEEPKGLTGWGGAVLLIAGSWILIWAAVRIIRWAAGL